MKINATDRAIMTDFRMANPELIGMLDSFHEYAASELAAMRPRFSQHDLYGAYTTDEFISTLGIDTSHHFHPVRQHHVMTRMLEQDFPDLSAWRRETFGLTATVHDMGEAKCEEGDVIFGTRVDEKAEDTARHVAIRAVAPERADEIIDRTDPVLCDKKSELYKIFRASEQIGYVLTGRRAAVLYLSSNPAEITAAQRRVAGVITTDILHRTFPVINEYKAEFGSVEAVLHAVSGPIETAEAAFLREMPEAHAITLQRLEDSRR